MRRRCLRAAVRDPDRLRPDGSTKITCRSSRSPRRRPPISLPRERPRRGDRRRHAVPAAPCSRPADLADGTYTFQVSGVRRRASRSTTAIRVVRRSTPTPGAPFDPSAASHSTHTHEHGHGERDRERLHARSRSRSATGSVGARLGRRDGQVVDRDRRARRGRQRARRHRRPTRRETSLAATGSDACGSTPSAPIATITKAPPTVTNNVHPMFEFTSNEPGATFQCRDYIPGQRRPATSSTAHRRTWCATWSTASTSSRSARGRRRSARAGVATRSRSTPSRRTRRRSPSRTNGTVLRDDGVDALGQTEPLTAVDVYDNGALLGPADDRHRGQRRLVPTRSPSSLPARTCSPRSRRTTPATSSQPSAPVTVYMHPNGPTAAIAGPTLTSDDTPTFT